MQYQFSKRMESLQPSLIREILKSTSDPEVISFAAGNPAPNAFPVEELTRIITDILHHDPIAALQYSVTEGYPALREACKRMLETHYHISTKDNDLIVISGAQQGADLAAKALVNEGDTVLCEDPSFIGCLNCFRSYNCNLVGVEMEEDGINTAKLEQAILQNPRVKLLYLIPNFQNPTGITTSLAKRREILRIAKAHNLVILEDNPYGDLRFAGEPVPSLKSMDTDGLVIYNGSFSKILAPGLRVGFVLAPAPIIAKMTVGKQCADVHTNILTQIACERWLATCDLDAHIARISEIYRQKCQLMLDCIDREFAPSIAHTTPEGGLFLWCTLPEGADMMEFCRRAVEKKVAVVPGFAFLADQRNPCRSFRMNFSTPTDEAIEKGIKLLGALTHTMF
ncbi:MAG: PLP-dependent aminotransferase family protein [Anaerotruncus sp.]|nr:PLP-dependent aminotransferase family protein [Anaerotruncus sp.]